MELWLTPGIVAFLLTELLIALLFHIIGVLCLIKEKQGLQKQRIILLNLSITEIVHIFYMIVYICMNVVDLTTSQLTTINNILIVAYHMVTGLFYCAMILISGDRLFSTLFPTTYYVYIHQSTLRKIVVVLWFFAISSSIVCFILPMDMGMYADLILSCSHALQIVFLVFSVVAYFLVIISHFRGQSLLGVRSKCNVFVTRMKRTCFISFSIITSFVIFYIVPNYIDKGSDQVFMLMSALSCVGLTVDPVLYIFLNGTLRASALQIIRCQWRSTRDRRITRTATQIEKENSSPTVPYEQRSIIDNQYKDYCSVDKRHHDEDMTDVQREMIQRFNERFGVSELRKMSTLSESSLKSLNDCSSGFDSSSSDEFERFFDSMFDVVSGLKSASSSSSFNDSRLRETAV